MTAPPCGNPAHCGPSLEDARRHGPSAAVMLYYATTFGLPVFPLAENLKIPAIPKRLGGQGFKDATTDVATIRGWGAEYPRANVGVATGRMPGQPAVVVIDLDRKQIRACEDGVTAEYQDGPGEFARWIAAGGFQLPSGPYQHTPTWHGVFGNPGAQLFFRAGDRAVESRKDAGGLWGVDVKADGGYVVVAPSRIWTSGPCDLRGQRVPGRDRSQGEYKWVGCPCQIPALPAEILDAISALPGTGTGGGGGGGSSEWTDPDIPALLAHGIGPDQPHEATVRDVAWKLVGDGKDDAEAYETLSAILGRTKLKFPAWPFTPDDLWRHINSARGKKPGAAYLDDGMRAVSGRAAKRVAAERAAEKADVAGQDGEDDAGAGEAPGERPPKPGLDQLVNRVLRLFEFARDDGGELFLLPAAGMNEPYIPRSFLTSDVLNLGHLVWRAMAEQWNAWAATLSRAERKQQGVSFAALTPSDTTVRNAVAHLQAIGMKTGRRVSAALRAVRVQGGDAIVVDLGDQTGEVAYVNASGWRVCDPRDLPCDPPVFRRSVGYFPLPHPVPGGDLGKLWQILRVTRTETQNLAGGWLVAAFSAGVSRPGLWFTGPPGAGKTTAGSGLGRLIDGLEWLDGRLDKADDRNNIIRAVKCYVPSFDNMTGVTPDHSDFICQLVTGHRDMFRRMRTNFDDISMGYKRTFVATGLALPYGLAADALDRIIEAPLERIPEGMRVSDEQIRRELDEARPKLLGALLDRVCDVLRVLPQIGDTQGGLSRMNDYARILMAHDRARGTGYLPAYLGSVRAMRADKADDEPVVRALKSWIAPGQQWHGALGQLLEELGRFRPAEGWWPPNEKSLSGSLTKNDGLLAGEGFTVWRSPDRRVIGFKRDAPQPG